MHPKRWTRTEYHRLGELGLLGTDRWELLQGTIYQIPLPTPREATVIRRAMSALLKFGAEHIRVRLPIVLSSEDEPEPDIAITTNTMDSYTEQHPGPEDIRLLVEVSSSTIQDDLTTKAGLYARAGIPEYWVLDVENRRLYVHRNPGSNGWGDIRNLAETESVTPLAAPQASIPVAILLG
jgi:Uma2 family endonuclease